MLLNLTISSLQEYLQENDFNPLYQKETDQIVVILKIGSSDFPLFFRLFEGNELLQLITFIPCRLIPKAHIDLARLLHLINKEIDLPGFGMDEKASIVYYRLMLIGYKGQIESSMLDSVLPSIRTSCETFAPLISSTAAGLTKYDEVLKKLEAEA